MIRCDKCGFGHRTVQELRACKSWSETVAEEKAENAAHHIPCSHDELKWGRKREYLGGKEIVVCGRCREEVTR